MNEINMKQWHEKDWVTYDEHSVYQLNQPFLILELTRIVPYIVRGKIRFHLFNLPNYKIGKVEIMGVIRHIDDNQDKYYKIQVDDGTGLIDVYLKKQVYKPDIAKRQRIDSLYKKQALNMDPNAYKSIQVPKSFPDPRPEFEYGERATLQQMAVLENKWWTATKRGLLGREFKLFDYIRCRGFPTLDREMYIQEKGKIEFDDLLDSRLTFFATEVTILSEEEYLKTFSTWMQNYHSKRYGN